MKKRITCITLFNEESLSKIKKILSKLENYNLCIETRGIKLGKNIR